MRAQTNVTLMTPDPTVATAVAAALHANGHAVTSPAIRDLRELSAQLSKSPVPIALIDLDPHPQQLLPQVEQIVARFPTTRFVALSSTLENDLLLEAMQTGVRRVVVKQTMGAQLAGVLDRLTPAANSGSATLGQVLTILSASGGCGATTLAVNLAEEIALKQKQPSLLCDFDCSYGAIAGFLGLNPRYAADHVLDYPEAIDAQLIRSTTTVYNDRIHVLASPASTNLKGLQPLRFDRLDQVLDSARRAYTTTIIDAPRLPLAIAATLAAASARTLLIFQLTVKDLRTARSIMDGLRERGVASESILPIANRYAKRQLISLDEASKALGGVEVLPIRNDYAPAIQGLNFGQLLSEAGPRSYLRRDLQELSNKLQPAVATAGVN
jgi:pilus assembly protein CpaE